jgi:hypothetical protein
VLPGAAAEPLGVSVTQSVAGRSTAEFCPFVHGGGGGYGVV